MPPQSAALTAPRFGGAFERSETEGVAAHILLAIVYAGV